VLRLSIRVCREQAELVLAELLELAPGGVEESQPDPETVEYSVYGATGELPELPDLKAAAGGALVEIRTEQLADDWAERWRSFHRPLVLEGRLTVRPPWEPAAGTPLDVVIDPGQAFGTGAHATTRLCLELLLDQSSAHPARGALADVGCGSGVLAIVAAQLGWQPVYALDYDPIAVAATRENATVNGVELDVRRLDLRSDQVPDCELAVANVLGTPLRAWSETQHRLPPVVILSGLLREEADDLADRFRQRGLAEVERRERAEWSALLLRHRSE
jgi:ribosomal protein L11 methyltransferase